MRMSISARFRPSRCLLSGWENTGSGATTVTLSYACAERVDPIGKARNRLCQSWRCISSPTNKQRPDNGQRLPAHERKKKPFLSIWLLLRTLGFVEAYLGGLVKVEKRPRSCGTSNSAAVCSATIFEQTTTIEELQVRSHLDKRQAYDEACENKPYRICQGHTRAGFVKDARKSVAPIPTVLTAWQH